MHTGERWKDLCGRVWGGWGAVILMRKRGEGECQKLLASGCLCGWVSVFNQK